jgi:hypothetical protein
MPTTTAMPTTACALLALVAPYRPAVQGDELVFAADVPADLDPAVEALQTGLRAVLTGRRWFGIEGATGRGTELDPGAPIPAGVTLLSVEGDERWDRIAPSARLDLPGLFAPPPRV